MTTYQKIAALIFRLASLGMIIHAAIVAASATLMRMPQAAWLIFPLFIAGLILYVLAIPLALLVTSGFGE